MNGLRIAAEALAAFLAGTILMDVVHISLHQFLKSKSSFLRAIGRVHRAHHRFFSADLQIKTPYARENILGHVLLEYITQVVGILICALFFSFIAIGLALIAATILFIAVCWWRGIDPHHRPYASLPAYRGGPFVSASYHALHHVYPNQFFSSYIKIVDYIFGTGLQLAGKKIAMTGTSGALGSNMKKLLEAEGAQVTALKFNVDYDYQNYDKLKEPLSRADILFLCHGSKLDFAQQANCDSYINIIELFKAQHGPRLIPLEVWAVGSEIECHPCFGIKNIKIYARSKRNYAREARNYFRDPSIQYRHMVHAAFTSPMGPGLMSAKFAAKVTLFMLKRGFRYIPVTYTGFAYLNYFRFVFNI